MSTLYVLASHNKARFPLRGDIDIVMDTAVSTTFSCRFFTQDTNTFTFTSANFQFLGFDGTLSNSITIGGKIGLFIEFMFNPTSGVWYNVANNVVGTASVTAEVELPLNLVGDTILNGATGDNFLINLTANGVMADPINMIPGQRIRIIVKQDATGGRTLGFRPKWAWLNGAFPVFSTAPGAYDILDGYWTAAGIMLTQIFKGYTVINEIASVGTTVFYTLGAAFSAATTGQTVEIRRNGKNLEATGSLIKAGTYTVKGVSLTGARPILELSSTTRPSFGKAILNIESGTAIIKDVVLTGARVVDDANAAGVRVNPGVTRVDLLNVYAHNNENGVLTAAGNYELNITDSLFNNNGQAGEAHAMGFTHNIYVGHNEGVVRVLRSSFTNSGFGHDFKSRGTHLIMDQVFCRGADNGRELDVPNGGRVYATNCSFIKNHLNGNEGQNTLIGVGQEGITPGRVEEYIFRNCHLENNIMEPGRDADFLDNDSATTAVRFIDCTFAGEYVLSRGSDAFKGLHSIEFTGGPLGPILTPGAPAEPLPADVPTFLGELPPISMDAATQSAYNAAIDGAVVGTKRLAAAQAVVDALKPDHRLRIFRDGVMIVEALYSSDAVVYDDGTNVFVQLGVPDSGTTLGGDLSTGTWTFVLDGGPGYGAVLGGTAGSLGTGKHIELTEDPVDGMGFATPVSFVVPLSVDGL